jgi:hypothetical protein
MTLAFCLHYRHYAFEDSRREILPITCDLRMGTMWQCGSCGYIINGGCEPGEHRCDPRSMIRHQVAQLDETFAAFLSSPAGRFELHYAQRRLKRDSPSAGNA